MKKTLAVLLAVVLMLASFASASEADLDGIGKSLLDYLGGFVQQSKEETEAAAEPETLDDESDIDSESAGEPLPEHPEDYDEWVMEAPDDRLLEDTTVPEEEIEEDYRTADESVWENILLLGCDAEDDSMRTRTDSMVILSINSAEGRVKMTSLMRDTWMQASGKEGHHKLTEFNVWGGPELTIRAINENFGMNLEKYALVNMKGLAQIIDILDGVDIEITESERKFINEQIRWDQFYGGKSHEPVPKSGLVHLNGAQALAYARIRYLDSDYVRTERQRDVLVAIAKNIRDGFDMKSILELISVLGDLVETNLSMVDLIRLAGTAMNLDLNNLEQFRVPVNGTFDSGMYGSTWCIKPNFPKNAKALYEFIYVE